MHYNSSFLYVDIIKLFLNEEGINCTDSGIAIPRPSLEPNSVIDRLPLKEALDLWGEASEVLSNPLLGLQIGSLLDLSEYGIFSHALMHAPRLYDALQLIHNYRYMMNDAFEGNIVNVDGNINYVLDFPVDHDYSYLFVEFHFSSIINLGRSIASRKYRNKVFPVKIDFSHAPATSEKDYFSIYNTDIGFHKEKNTLSFPADVLMLPTQTPNVDLYQFFMRNIDKAYRLNLNPRVITHRLYQIFASRSKNEEWPSQADIAKRMNMSLSTLKRKLKLENCTYQYIFDSYRFKASKSMLKQGVRISEISDGLGFSSTASFGRSFKRWSGLTVGEYVKYL